MSTLEKKISAPEIIVKSPLNGEVIGSAPAFSLAEAMQALARARAAQVKWAALSHRQRRRVMVRFLEALHRRADELAELLSREAGKTLYESYLFEVVSLIHLTAYFVRRAERILTPKRLSISLFRDRRSYLHYRPRGVVFVIAPWNFPLGIPGGEVIMSLLAGNAVLLKPASLTPLIALKLRELFDDAGLDSDLFQVVTCAGSTASQLIEAGVDYVNFTGSTDTGRQVAALCGAKMIPHSMELGGKAPAIVLPDADLKRAVRSVVWGAFANSGQICASVERVFVHESIYEQFVAEARQLTESLRQGDPFIDGDIDIGAMTDEKQIEIVEDLLADAQAKGARILTGGRRLIPRRQFFMPTILVDVTTDMRIMREESFGPLMPIMPFADEDEAVRLANDSDFGLLAYVFSRDTDRARKVAERVEAGTVMINEVLMSHAFPETPWGGVKQSGIGFVHSDDGLRALCHAAHVNYNTLPMPNPVPYPYNARKLKVLFKSLSWMNLSLVCQEKARKMGRRVLSAKCEINRDSH